MWLYHEISLWFLIHIWNRGHQTKVLISLTGDYSTLLTNLCFFVYSENFLSKCEQWWTYSAFIFILGFRKQSCKTGVKVLSVSWEACTGDFIDQVYQSKRSGETNTLINNNIRYGRDKREKFPKVCVNLILIWRTLNLVIINFILMFLNVLKIYLKCFHKK